MIKQTFRDSPCKYCTLPEAKERYRLGRQTIMRLASENNALFKIGKSVRVDILKLDSVIENMKF